jgi:predicted DNA-binding protein YlxM (UPF0122 family)
MDFTQQFNNSMLFEFYGNLLTDKQKDMLTDFLDNNLSLTEIAESYGITRQAANDLIKRTLKVLENYESKLGLLRRFYEVKDKVNESIALLDKGEVERVKGNLNSILEDF